MIRKGNHQTAVHRAALHALRAHYMLFSRKTSHITRYHFALDVGCLHNLNSISHSSKEHIKHLILVQEVRSWDALTQKSGDAP